MNEDSKPESGAGALVLWHTKAEADFLAGLIA
jgi:hypothetical protein